VWCDEMMFVVQQIKTKTKNEKQNIGNALPIPDNTDIGGEESKIIITIIIMVLIHKNKTQQFMRSRVK
jgi:hypothetical protein